MATLLYGTAAKLLGELSASTLQEISKLWGLGSKHEFKKLRCTLSTIKAVLLDAEQKQETIHELKDWLKKLKTALHEVEDLLDDFSAEVLRRKVMTRGKKAKKVHIFFSRSNQIAYRLKMGSKVKGVLEKMNAIAEDRTKFGLVVGQEELHVGKQRREESHSFVNVDRVIGREGDRDVVVQLLRSDVEANMSAISIVGIGGLGKTTLAQLVYKVEKESQHFELVMWVCVSDVFNVKLICKSIIKSATNEACQSLEMEGVKDELKIAIDGKRYLLVLDDVWNEDRMEWLKLQDLLLGGARGSKILLTTRTQLVASTVKSSAIHMLKGLSDEDSWSLFKQMAFEQEREPQSLTIREIGKAIVEKCSGVPLAIKAIGSMFSEEDTESDWLYFKNNNLPKITQESKSCIMPILKLSYDYLPSHLKQCFAYCAVFPKDHEISKDTLIQMWIAHRFIHSSDSEGNEILEEVGGKYFMELLKRSFFQEHKTDKDGGEYCKMHDLIHELAQSVQNNEAICAVDLGSVGDTTRHAWISKGIQTFSFEGKNLRTCLCYEEIWCGLKLNKIMGGLGRIRVLKLWLDVPNLPRSIGRLVHLSYLDLSFGTFLRLPESICSLHTLQTLILERCFSLEELPERIKDLVNLRHLNIKFCRRLCHMPRGLGKLSSLQSLTNFVIGPKGGTLGEQLDQLSSLDNLRGELAVHCSGAIQTTDERVNYHFPLRRLSFLEVLTIECFLYPKNDDEEENLCAQFALLESLQPPANLKMLHIESYKVLSFPSWMNSANICSSLPNIVRISLEHFCCISLPPLGLLPSLQYLGLIMLRSVEYIYDDDKEEGEDISSSLKARQLFPSLKTLHLIGLRELKGLGRRKIREVEAQHFPVLEELRIDHCPLLDFLEANHENEKVKNQFQRFDNLKTLKLKFCYKLKIIPEWMSNIVSLEHLQLDHCPSLESLGDSMRRLTSLQQLIITNCSPELAHRGRRETGDDWPNLAHIPILTIKAYVSFP